MVSSYAVNIVGGVPQITRANHMPKKDTTMTQVRVASYDVTIVKNRHLHEENAIYFNDFKCLANAIITRANHMPKKDSHDACEDDDVINTINVFNASTNIYLRHLFKKKNVENVYHTSLQHSRERHHNDAYESGSHMTSFTSVKIIFVIHDPYSVRRLNDI